jgi:hypothetical protein
MTSSPAALLDRHGHVTFHCRSCGAAVSAEDFFEVGRRLPDPVERAGEYCDAKLIDGVEHVACSRPAPGGGSTAVD